MRVALEARALTRPASGITTYVHQLVVGLQAHASGHEFMVLEQGPTSDLALPLWLNTTVPRWLVTQRPNVVHFTKAALPFVKKYPTVVTIYDVIPILFPQSQKTLARIIWPSTLRHAARVADQIITISEASKRDIVEQLQVPPEKITVTPLAVASAIRQQAVDSTKSGAPYILFLGTIEPRKNVPALVRAFARIAADVPHQLVIAGRHYKDIESTRAAIRATGLADRVALRDFVPAQELPSLYANADLFVWPSIYEGWGFPPQEAMAAGVPVIVSDGGSLPEVVGEAGEIVPFTAERIIDRTHDEAFEAALADRMRHVLSDSARQQRMREAGFAQIKKTTWEQVAQTTLAVYQRIVGQ